MTICGIDIGTKKIAALIGVKHASGFIEVVGIGSNPCRGVQGGVVVNIEATVNSIREAIHQAEAMAQTKVTKAFVGMAAPHISSANSHGSVALQRQEVGQEELDRALEAARAIPVDGNHMLHVLSQGYVVDHQDGIRDPRGMSGSRLESKVHVVTCSANAVANLATCMQRCDIDIEQIVFEPLASAYAVLTNDEMELGVCLVDIGGGTTDIVVYGDGSVRHTKVFPMAGDELTRNIAKSLRTPIKSAEYLKVMYACAHHDLIPNENSAINVPGVGERPDRTLSRATLTDIVGTWYRSLFEQIRQEILDACIAFSSQSATTAASATRPIVESRATRT